VMVALTIMTVLGAVAVSSPLSFSACPTTQSCWNSCS
jgi:hypothetical protein